MGHLTVQERLGWSWLVHARELLWPRWEAEEGRFEAAEDVRELYVAATRAGDELVVARNPDAPDTSPWAAFEPWLRENGRELSLRATTPPDPETAQSTPDEMRDRIASVETDRANRARPGYLIRSVSERAKEALDESSGQLSLGFSSDELDAATGPSRGIPWGLAVHGALAAAMRGIRGAPLRGICRSVLVENHRPLGPDGEPRELAELVGLVEAMCDSNLWSRAEEARRTLVEAPFMASMPSTDGTDLEMVEGVVDLAFLEDDGWVIVDYKTDVGGDPHFEERVRGYRRQVSLYGRAWESLTSQEVKERVLYFTARPEATERW